MGAEDYFPWDKRKERGPIEIIATEITNTGTYRLFYKAQGNIDVVDRTPRDRASAQIEIERIVKILSGERGYELSLNLVQLKG